MILKELIDGHELSFSKGNLHFFGFDFVLIIVFIDPDTNIICGESPILILVLNFEFKVEIVCRILEKLI